jgi:hypothetical protein
MNEIEKKIYYRIMRMGTYDEPVTSDNFEILGFSKRQLAAFVRDFNRRYDGLYMIGSTDRGYYIPRNEIEADASIKHYSKRIMTMLKERKSMKHSAHKIFTDEQLGLFDNTFNL